MEVLEILEEAFVEVLQYVDYDHQGLSVLVLHALCLQVGESGEDVLDYLRVLHLDSDVLSRELRGSESLHGERGVLFEGLEHGSQHLILFVL